MVLLNQNRYEEAEQDTSHILETLAPDHAKVWYHQVMAREGRAIQLLPTDTSKAEALLLHATDIQTN
jgi:hypothetical protein